MPITVLMTLHAVGLILWIGGALSAGRVLGMAASEREPAREALLDLAGELLRRMGVPGMILTIGTGTGMIAVNASYYLGQGWLHAKMALALVPLGATIWLMRERGRKEPPRPRTIAWCSRALAGSALLLLLLAFVRPF